MLPAAKFKLGDVIRDTRPGGVTGRVYKVEVWEVGILYGVEVAGSAWIHWIDERCAELVEVEPC